MPLRMFRSAAAVKGTTMTSDQDTNNERPNGYYWARLSTTKSWVTMQWNGKTWMTIGSRSRIDPEDEPLMEVGLPIPSIEELRASRIGKGDDRGAVWSAETEISSNLRLISPTIFDADSLSCFTGALCTEQTSERNKIPSALSQRRTNKSTSSA